MVFGRLFHLMFGTLPVVGVIDIVSFCLNTVRYPGPAGPRCYWAEHHLFPSFSTQLQPSQKTRPRPLLAARGGSVGGRWTKSIRPARMELTEEQRQSLALFREARGARSTPLSLSLFCACGSFGDGCGAVLVGVEAMFLGGLGGGKDTCLNTM